MTSPQFSPSLLWGTAKHPLTIDRSFLSQCCWGQQNVPKVLYSICCRDSRISPIHLLNLLLQAELNSCSIDNLDKVVHVAVPVPAGILKHLEHPQVMLLAKGYGSQLLVVGETHS